jgi:hypothetical protein
VGVPAFLRLVRTARLTLTLAVACLIVASLGAQESDTSHLAPFDQILDVYVRGGDVYYRALKLERGRLDRYVAQLAIEAVDKASRDEQLAFWLNAYDALVLRTVIDHYPIQGQDPGYPPRSIRQIPGAFERLTHRVAGRSLTLDQIEQTVLPTFHDPRVYFAIGRGTHGGGRLRSEAFTPVRLEAQLAEAARECVSRVECLQIDRGAGNVSLSAVFSWREKEFSAAYAGSAPAAFASRSPIERAALAFVDPGLLASERAFLGANTFRVVFKPFDWTLNDLTGRGGR